MLDASYPLYVVGVCILLIMIALSPFLYPSPDGWYRSIAALVVLVVVTVAWRGTQNWSLTMWQSDVLQFLMVLAATGMCVAARLWTPASELTPGFVVVPLVLSVMFRSIRASLLANALIAIAWAITWQASGQTFTGHRLILHFLVVPLLSIALSVTQQKALRKLDRYHREQQKSIQEQNRAMQIAAEESYLRMESEKQLERKHALLESILSTVPEEIFVKDRERNILVVNRAYLEDLNLKPENVLGQSTDKFIPTNLVETSLETDMAVLRDGKHVHFETVAVYEDGTQKIFEIEKLPLIEFDEIAGIVGIARDITHRKETEERLKEQEIMLLHASRLSSMGELVAGIAHEINQPLYSILNYAKAVKNVLDGSEEPDLADVGNWTGQILKEATRGGEITRRLRSFVRRAETQREETDLTAIVQESIDFISGEARYSNVRISRDFEEDLSPVLVDRVQIQQVLVNLLKNAIEALRDQHAKSRQVVVSTRNVPAGVEVAVADNGPGIPAELIESITEPFFTTKNEGIGLGLAISNTIITAHDSELICETNEWGGATLRFTLGGGENTPQKGRQFDSILANTTDYEN